MIRNKTGGFSKEGFSREGDPLAVFDKLGRLIVRRVCDNKLVTAFGKHLTRILGNGGSDTKNGYSNLLVGVLLTVFFAVMFLCLFLGVHPAH